MALVLMFAVLVVLVVLGVRADERETRRIDHEHRARAIRRVYQDALREKRRGR